MAADTRQEFGWCGWEIGQTKVVLYAIRPISGLIPLISVNCYPGGPGHNCCKAAGAMGIQDMGRVDEQGFLPVQADGQV